MTGGIALILGDFGRNFAAGMSGGIAYLYSNDGNFDEKKFNLEMVELEDLQDGDLKTIKDLIINHVEYTKSPKGIEILKDCNNSYKNFIKVIPTYYNLALEMLANDKLEKSF